MAPGRKRDPRGTPSAWIGCIVLSSGGHGRSEMKEICMDGIALKTPARDVSSDDEIRIEEGLGGILLQGARDVRQGGRPRQHARRGASRKSVRTRGARNDVEQKRGTEVEHGTTSARDEANELEAALAATRSN